MGRTSMSASHAAAGVVVLYSLVHQIPLLMGTYSNAYRTLLSTLEPPFMFPSTLNRFRP